MTNGHKIEQLLNSVKTKTSLMDLTTSTWLRKSSITRSTLKHKEETLCTQKASISMMILKLPKTISMKFRRNRNHSISEETAKAVGKYQDFKLIFKLNLNPIQSATQQDALNISTQKLKMDGQ